MARASWLLGATSIAGLASSLWLYFDNRSLRALAGDRSAVVAAAPLAALAERDPWLQRTPASSTAPRGRSTVPVLPMVNEESRLDRRKRGQEELAAMFGRAGGETEDEYRARIAPLIKGGLAIPRSRVEDMRKLAEDKAHVTPEQSKRLDRAFDKVYGDVLDFTNKAVADGQLSPYERNVAGWLEFAGGLGGILTDAQGQIGTILDAGQVRAMTDSGFEWGEYLGLEAPWEKLVPPPPSKPR